MKNNKIKFLSIITTFSLWSQTQCMDNVNNINQYIEDYRRTQSALLDRQFSIQNRELEANLARRGASESTAGQEARAFAARNETLIRQQASINDTIFIEHLANLRLSRDIYISNIQQSVNIYEMNSNLIMYFKAAGEGNTTAQINLGNAYRDGRGVIQSDTEALSWYRKAADQGSANAQSNLGWMYKNGRGVVQSDTEALSWYRKAADQGSANAQFNLGVFYYLGQGVKKNDIEASNWCRKAAEQGDATAQFYLGNMYKNGFGVMQSNVEALAWYIKSASQGNPEAQQAIDRLKGVV